MTPSTYARFITDLRCKEPGARRPGLFFELDPIRHRVGAAAPSRAHSVRRSRQHRFHLVKQALLRLERFGNFPRVGFLRSADDAAAIRRREVTILSGIVIEEAEGDDDATLLVDGDVAAVAD